MEKKSTKILEKVDRTLVITCLFVFVTNLLVFAQKCSLGCIYVSKLCKNLFVFTNRNKNTVCQRSAEGFIYDLFVNGPLTIERTSGPVPFPGKVCSICATLNVWTGNIGELKDSSIFKKT